MADVRTGRNAYLHIKKEGTYNTYVTPDLQIRMSSEAIIRKIDLEEDPALIGKVFTTERVKVGDGAGGGVEMVCHGNEIGPLLHGVLGGEAAVADPVEAYIVVSFNEADNWARLSIVGTDMIAEVSTNGVAWNADTNFATTGTLDLTAGVSDTAGEIATLIAGYTGYDSKLFGKAASLATGAVTVAVTNLRANDVTQGAFLVKFAIAASTTAKVHTLTPAASNALLPSFTVQASRALGTNKSVAWTGCKFGSITVAPAAKAFVKASLDVLATKELVDQADVASSPPTSQGFIGPKVGLIVIQQDGSIVDMTEVKDTSLSINSNPDENRVLNDYYIKEPIRQGSTIEHSFNANNIATQYALRTDYINSTPVQTFIYMESNTDADTTNSIPFSMLVRLPRSIYSDMNSTASGPDRMVITGSAMAEEPQNAVYTDVIEILVVDDDTTTY